MLSKFEFTPDASAANTSTVVFDIGEVDTSGMPITHLQFEYEVESPRRPIPQLIGTYLVPVRHNAILIHIEFDIIGTDTDDFNAKKRALQSAFVPADPTQLINLGTQGYLVLNFDGDTEDIASPVNLDGDISVPYVGPTYSNCQMTLAAIDGYFIGQDTSDFYYPK